MRNLKKNLEYFRNFAYAFGGIAIAFIGTGLVCLLDNLSLENRGIIREHIENRQVIEIIYNPDVPETTFYSAKGIYNNLIPKREPNHDEINLWK